MGRKQRALQEILSAVSGRNIPRLQRCEILQSNWADEVNAVYSRLGGKLDCIPVNAQATWDIDLGGVAVELDEQLHFNRYRAHTLESRVYEQLLKFPKKEYVEYCKLKETECLRASCHIGKWKKPRAEMQFGESSLPGVLEAPGPSRWKQRAFYDFQKDIATMITGQPVVRIAIWDEIDVSGRRVCVDEALGRPCQEFHKPLRELVERRIP